MDFVTVFFDIEYPLLLLQARSLSRYLNRNMVGRLVVVDNSRPGIRPAQKSALNREYADLAPRVELITPRELGIAQDTQGDRGQQTLKLAAADYVSTSHYVVLDAKNHLVDHMDTAALLAPDGRSKVAVHSYRGHPREHGLQATLEYFGLDDRLIDRFTASTTPFVIETAAGRGLLRYVEGRSAEQFAAAFVKTGMTEFPAYTGWLLNQGHTIDESFFVTELARPTLWAHLANLDGVRQMTERAQTSGPIFAVHREALARLDSPSAQALAGFWVSRELFPSEHEALRFIATFRARRRLLVLRRKLRRAPHWVRRSAAGCLTHIRGLTSPNGTRT